MLKEINRDYNKDFYQNFTTSRNEGNVWKYVSMRKVISIYQYYSKNK